MSDVTQKNGQYYYISTVDTFDDGWETMVFCCDKNGDVTDWGNPVESFLYESEEEAVLGHKRFVERFS